MNPTIAVSTGPAYSRLLSVGSYRPARIVTNEEICQHIDSTDEWIRERSGIIERRWAAPDESVVDMAYAAATSALDRSGLDRADIGMVMVANISHPYPVPSVSALLTGRLGTHRAAAIDIAAACAGFCYGIGIADSIIRSGAARHILVVGVEKLTDWTDPHDRSTAFIFADGAGAVVIGPSDTPAIGPVVWGADGEQSDAISMSTSLVDHRRDPDVPFPTIVMQGQRVFRWAVSEMSRAAQAALDAAGIPAADLDAFIPHQANMRITDAIVRTLGLPAHVPVARDIETTGNTSAASIPIAMDRMLSSGAVPSGGLALTIGFGAGLTYAAQVVRLP